MKKLFPSKSCKETQILFLVFCLVSEKPEEKNVQIMANQTSCKLVGMRAFMSTMFEFKKSHANVSIS